jgi:hypothetical protein
VPLLSAAVCCCLLLLLLPAAAPDSMLACEGSGGRPCRSLTLPVPPSLPSPRLLFADWIQRPRQAGQVPCSPLTNEPLADLTLRPNHMACSLIATMRAAGLLP